jgi:protein disulfide-isomerase A1
LNPSPATGEKEFAAILKAHPFVVAEFYAPWCGHCKTLAPEYEKAAAELDAGATGIKLVKVDATEDANKALAEKYGVKGFPTLKIFKGGKGEPADAVDYAGPREAAGIVSHLTKLAGPASALVADAKALAAAKEAHDVVVVGVFKSAKDAAFKAFEAAGDRLRDDAAFLHTFDAALVPGAAAPSIVLHKKYDEPTATFEGKADDTAAIVSFVDAATEPELVELDQTPRMKKVLAKVFQSDEPKLLAFVGADHKKAADFRAALIAAKAVGGASILLVDPVANGGAVQFFGLTDADLPALAVHAPKANAKYIKAKAAAKDVKAFLAAFSAGKLSPHVKSETPPKKNDGPVVVATANTFEKLVLTPKGATAVVKFYAPWCGHCKTLAPIWDKLGEAFKADKKVVVAKYDMTANDLPPGSKFEVKGFPTIVLFKDGKHTTYTGERTEEAIAAFVKAGGVLAPPSAGDDEPAKDEL